MVVSISCSHLTNTHTLTRSIISLEVLRTKCMAHVGMKVIRQCEHIDTKG